MFDQEIRPLDRARAAQLVVAHLTADASMLTNAFEAIMSDDWGFGECGSLLNVIRALSDDLATIMVTSSGTTAAIDTARSYLATCLAAVAES